MAPTRTPQSGWRLGVKRTSDRIVAATGLVLTAPLLASIAVAVRVTMGSPVLFRQTRPGRNARPFQLIKFRTMTEAKDENGRILPDAKRLTPLGQLLRSTSLDELPQLINVLRGELSLVGPRPLLMEYLPLYSREQARRHDVLPGITGWAQVNGRNSRTWPEKLALDVWYVDNWSLLLDARILARTLVQVIKRSGISAEDHVSMPVFQGEQH